VPGKGAFGIFAQASGFLEGFARGGVKGNDGGALLVALETRGDKQIGADTVVALASEAE
jgi:hypothetical protein